MRSITVWFTEEEYIRLDALAALYGTLPSEFLKELFIKQDVKITSTTPSTIPAPEPSEDRPTSPEGPTAIRLASYYPHDCLHEDEDI